MTRIKIQIICPYPIGLAPSQRFRFEQYLPLLKKEGFEFSTQSFLSQKAWNKLYLPGNYFAKFSGITSGFLRRTKLLFQLTGKDFVFIHREASPLGPPVFEWIIARILKKRIIYDFDDAIWLSNTSDSNRMIRNLKWHKKVASICSWSHKISCGNSFLAAFASKYNPNVQIIPTTIDLNLHQKTEKVSGLIKTIGWTGSHSTSSYLKQIVPALEELSQDHDFIFKVISNIKPDFEIPNLLFVPWSLENEIRELQSFDVGVMPLPDNDWSKGKCAFKALQYMSLGIPSILSPVGMNADLVNHGENGFMASTKDEWVSCLKILLDDENLAKKIGDQGENTIKDKFTVERNIEKYRNLFSKL